MNIKALSACSLSLALVSCSAFDPEYQEYKKQKESGTESNATPNADPYSNIANNPYGVPSNSPQGGGEVGQYSPNPTTPPYQPLPGVPSGQSSYPSIPNNTTPTPGYTGTAPTYNPGTVSTHVVAKGDSLWSLSQKYGTSVDSIRQANGLNSDLIVVGQTLQIPR